MKFNYDGHVWEGLPNNRDYQTTERMQVPGGWVIKHTQLGGPMPARSSLCFVPDPDHEWEI